jgi:hypothetical protein
MDNVVSGDGGPLDGNKTQVTLVKRNNVPKIKES